jgi:hypothetical protein
MLESLKERINIAEIKCFAIIECLFCLMHDIILFKYLKGEIKIKICPILMKF